MIDRTPGVIGVKVVQTRKTDEVSRTSHVKDTERLAGPLVYRAVGLKGLTVLTGLPM